MLCTGFISSSSFMRICLNFEEKMCFPIIFFGDGCYKIETNLFLLYILFIRRCLAASCNPVLKPANLVLLTNLQLYHCLTIFNNNQLKIHMCDLQKLGFFVGGGQQNLVLSLRDHFVRIFSPQGNISNIIILKTRVQAKVNKM